MPNDGIQSAANRFCIWATPASNRTSLPPKIIIIDIAKTAKTVNNERIFDCSPLKGAIAMISAATAGRNTRTLRNAAGGGRAIMANTRSQDSEFGDGEAAAGGGAAPAKANLPPPASKK